MAGIGIDLERLTRADRLSSNLLGMAHAGLISSGPWLIACGALLAISIVGQGRVKGEVLREFAILVMYNFSFSLVASGAIVLVVTRRVADNVHSGNARGVPDLLVGALCLVFAVNAAVACGVYGFALALPPEQGLLGGLGLLLTGGIWLASAFLASLKRYGSIASCFTAGMLLAIVGASYLSQGFGLSGLLAGFTLGLGVVFFALLACLLAGIPGRIEQVFGWFSEFRRLWQLALVGVLYNAAIWADKWVMWFAPSATRIGPSMLSHEAYEGAMFLAFLSIVPALALLLVVIETHFYPVYREFYRSIGEHATLRAIRRHRKVIAGVLLQGLRRIALLQTVICLVGMILAPALVSAVGGGAEMVPILRFGLLGALFHMLLIATLAVLAYFDLRRELLLLSGLFLVLNAGLTAATSRLGVEYQGYGYCIAALLSFVVSCFLLITRLARLPYLSFVGNNPALRQRG